MKRGLWTPSPLERAILQRRLAPPLRERAASNGSEAGEKASGASEGARPASGSAIVEKSVTYNAPVTTNKGPVTNNNAPVTYNAPVTNIGNITNKGPVTNNTTNNAAPVCEEAEDEPLPDRNGVPQSRYPGVKWNSPRKKWIGAVPDITQRYSNGKAKELYTSLYSTDVEAAAALAVLRADVARRVEAARLANLAKDPVCRDLPRGPDDPAEAERKTAYWRPHAGKDGDPLVPFKAVVMSSGKQGLKWTKACSEKGCWREEIGGGKCQRHGGGCPHGRRWYACQAASCKGADVTKLIDRCDNCGNVLGAWRQKNRGGPGICATCEAKEAERFAELGIPYTKKVKGRRIEFVVLDDMLRPLVVDENGVVISAEIRDAYVGLGCKDVARSRPDTLWVVRSDTGRLVAVINVELDERSHTDRKPPCEVGKVGKTFTTVCNIAREEAAKRAEAAKKRGEEVPPGEEEFIPYVLTIKINPDPYKNGPSLEARVQWLAEQVNAFLARPWTDFEAMPEEQRMLPNVKFAFYNSQKQLDYFNKEAPGAMHILGNYKGDGGA